MQTKSIIIDLPYGTYLKIEAIASKHFKSPRKYIKTIVSDSIREEFELKNIKKQVAPEYSTNEISYEYLKNLFGNEEAERLRIYKETILEPFSEADAIAKRLKSD